MVEASKTAELSSQPTKRGRRAWLIALAVVVAVVTIVLLATPPKQEPVKVWFVRATNEAGVKKLVFEGTNGTAGEIVVFVDVVTGAIYQATVPNTGILTYSFTNVIQAEGRRFGFALKAPPKDVPYYVTWGFFHTPKGRTRWERLRWSGETFLRTHGMILIANQIVREEEVHIIPSTEIKE